MRPRDRFFSALFTIGYVVAILWTILYAVETASILNPGEFFNPPSGMTTPFGRQLGVAQQSICRALLGVVMTVVFVRGVERIRRPYRTDPRGFAVRPRR